MDLGTAADQKHPSDGYSICFYPRAIVESADPEVLVISTSLYNLAGNDDESRSQDIIPHMMRISEQLYPVVYRIEKSKEDCGYVRSVIASPRHFQLGRDSWHRDVSEVVNRVRHDRRGRSSVSHTDVVSRHLPKLLQRVAHAYLRDNNSNSDDLSTVQTQTLEENYPLITALASDIDLCSQIASAALQHLLDKLGSRPNHSYPRLPGYISTDGVNLVEDLSKEADVDEWTKALWIWECSGQYDLSATHSGVLSRRDPLTLYCALTTLPGMVCAQDLTADYRPTAIKVWDLRKTSQSDKEKSFRIHRIRITGDSRKGLCSSQIRPAMWKLLSNESAVVIREVVKEAQDAFEALLEESLGLSFSLIKHRIPASASVHPDTSESSSMEASRIAWKALHGALPSAAHRRHRHNARDILKLRERVEELACLRQVSEDAATSGGLATLMSQQHDPAESLAISTAASYAAYRVGVDKSRQLSKANSTASEEALLNTRKGRARSTREQRASRRPRIAPKAL